MLQLLLHRLLNCNSSLSAGCYDVHASEMLPVSGKVLLGSVGCKFNAQFMCCTAPQTASQPSRCLFSCVEHYDGLKFMSGVMESA